MFENLSHLALQQYWWVIVSLLASILVFLMFVQGGQTLIYSIGKTNNQRSVLINAIGRKWELTFTTLVTFGGAFFASFPLFYATSFGGAYWVWMLILFGFILQAVSFEYRKKKGNVLGSKTYELFLFFNGLLATILIGAAVSTFFTGSEFSVNEYNLSRWENTSRGLEAALNIQNLALGLSVFFLARIMGSMYFINYISSDEILAKARKQVVLNAILFLIFFLIFLVLLLTKQGFAVNPQTGNVFMEEFKYLNNFLQMPVVLVMFLLGVVLVLWGIYKSYFKKAIKAFWIASPGIILVVFSLFMVAGFNNTAFYPSTFDLQSSLTIQNASSSHYTLTAMSYVSLFVPFVIAYIWYAWRSLAKKKIDEAEITDSIENDEHVY